MSIMSTDPKTMFNAVFCELKTSRIVFSPHSAFKQPFAGKFGMLVWKLPKTLQNIPDWWRLDIQACSLLNEICQLFRDHHNFQLIGKPALKAVGVETQQFRLGSRMALPQVATLNFKTIHQSIGETPENQQLRWFNGGVHFQHQKHAESPPGVLRNFPLGCRISGLARLSPGMAPSGCEGGCEGKSARTKRCWSRQMCRTRSTATWISAKEIILQFLTGSWNSSYSS